MEAGRAIRQFVFQVLMPLEQASPPRMHIEEALDQGYAEKAFRAEDRRFGTYLAYGVLRNWFALSTLIVRLSKRPLNKIEPRVRLLLRMGLYQLHEMASVPDYAAVSTTMALATYLKLSAKSRGFLNAVLQGYIRQGKPWPQNPLEQLPDWWLKRLSQQHDLTTVQHIAQALQSIPALTLRINTLKTSVKAYAEVLHQAEIAFTPSPHVPEVLYITTPQGDPRTLPGYAEGWFIVQDESSARVARFLDPQPGESILELGAAPGTKTTHLAALMANQGKIYAIDPVQSRMEKLLENCARLGVSIVEPRVASGETLDQTVPPVDKVLIDAPCSGTGTLGKHPEILLALKPQDITRNTVTQSALLAQGFAYLKPGGVLVYSVCSIDNSEGQAVVKNFMHQHAMQAVLEEDILILPDAAHDGFYLAKIRKQSGHTS